MPLTDAQITRAMQGAPKLVSGTFEVMSQLVRLLKREIEIVTGRKMSEHPALLKEKQKYAMDYRSNMKSIAAQPDLMKKLPQEVKEALTEMARKLAQAVDENARTLRAAVDATRQLIQNVMAMVRSEVMPRQTYKNSARAHLELGTYSPTCQPVAISRVV